MTIVCLRAVIELVVSEPVVIELAAVTVLSRSVGELAAVTELSRSVIEFAAVTELSRSVIELVEMSKCRTIEMSK